MRESPLNQRKRIDTDALAGSHKTPQYRSGLSVFITAKEDPVVAAYCYAADRALGAVVVDLEICVLSVAGEGDPVLQGVTNRPPLWDLRQYPV
jgi:hypothetical protein